MFEASFFDRHSLINYQLFRAMKTLQQTTMSINTLSRNTGLSYSQTYTAFQTVLAQLNQILPDKKIDESSFAAVLPDVSIDRYRFSLLKNSLPLNFSMGFSRIRIRTFTPSSSTIKQVFQRYGAEFRRFETT